jgi:putative ABC transport system permease protein
MLDDIRYAVRSLRRAPAFTLLVAATLAIGIGANTAMFSIVNAVLLEPFGYPDAGSILKIRGRMSHPDFVDMAEGTSTLSAVGAFRGQRFDYSAGMEPERLDGVAVTGTTLELFGARPVAGRLISPDDDRAGAERVVVVTEHFWRTRLASATDVVGRRISLSGQSYTIVGVLAAGFSLPATPAEIVAAYTPVAGREATARGAHTLHAFGRLAPGTSTASAQQDLEALASRLTRQYPESNTDVRFLLQTLTESVAGAVRDELTMLLWTVGFVLLIACVNVANFMFARVSARRGELAVRAAIGATRGRIVRQVLTESVLLAVFGGALGLALAGWLTQAIVAVAPETVPRLEGAAVDVRVLLYACLLSVTTGILFGAVPSWTSATSSLPDAARGGSRTTRRGNRLRGGLLVAEVALAFVLLVGAGLLLRSFSSVLAQRPGFDTNNLLTGNVTLADPRYATAVSRARFWETVEERIRALPGVDDVALTSDLPIGGSPLYQNLAFEGKPTAPGTEPEVYNRSVNDGFFRAMGIPLVKGRVFNSTDRESSPLVAVVNEAFVRQYYPGEDVLGKRIRWASDGGPWITIVGVVGDVRGLSLEQAEVPAVHMPIAQERNSWRRWMDIAIRARGEAAALAPSLRRQIAAVDPQVPVTRVRLMHEVIDASVADRRFSLLMLGGFALVALLLAAAGTYGVMANLVAQRTREVGVRLALGATPRDIFGLIVLRGLCLAAVGVAVGLASAAALTRALQAMLFGVDRLDSTTFVLAILVLLLSAAGASCWPARRASRTDPLIALRSE